MKPTFTQGDRLSSEAHNLALHVPPVAVQRADALGMAMPFRIQVAFIPGPVAVNERQAIEMLGWNDGRSEHAAKHAFWEFRIRHGITKQPGGVFSVRRIIDAADDAEAIKAANKARSKKRR